MKPAARIAAAIDVLEAIARTGPGAGRILADYFRRRRYAGSKDRTAVATQVYAVLRRQRRLDWWLARFGTESGPRTRLLAELALSGAMTPGALSALFDGSQHAPPPLSAAESILVERLAGAGLDHADMPLDVRGECPTWIAERLQAAFGDTATDCLAALDGQAGFDLRINPLKCDDRDDMRRTLRKLGLETEPTPYSPCGLRASRRLRIEGFAPFRDGAIEIQDEGAQLAALLVAAGPGMQVVDFCAGAGGKTLVLGAAMNNQGRVLAADIDPGRLQRAAARVVRAGLHNVERRVIKEENDRYLKRWSGRFDRVLVDAPCTGIGAWRRDPEARSRYAAADLAPMTALQDRILARAASLVRPGGRLVYVTCSLLAEENEERIAHLLEKRAGFHVMPAGAVWRTVIEPMGAGPYPGNGDMLRLTPHEHGTDGFFVAVLRREGGL